MSSNSVNLLNVDPTQSQFNEINALINTINTEISDLNEELTSEVNNINTLFTLKANSSDVNNSIVGINARLDNKVNSYDLATTINNLNTATTNALNANAVSFVSMLTLTNATIQSELALKADLDNMVSGFTNLSNNINLTNITLTSGFTNLSNNINLTNNNLISGFSNINNNLISSVSSINNNIISSVSSMNNNFNNYNTITQSTNLLSLQANHNDLIAGFTNLNNQIDG
jgi:hypothetical protein